MLIALFVAAVIANGAAAVVTFHLAKRSRDPLFRRIEAVLWSLACVAWAVRLAFEFV